MEQVHQRKLAKYEDVVEGATVQGYNAECFAVEVGSRGLIVEGKLQQLNNALGAPARAMTELAGSLFQDCNARIFQDLVLQECAAVTVSYYQTLFALPSFYPLLILIFICFVIIIIIYL